MPVRDLFHNAVKRALQKDGWTITHDPLYFDLDDYEIYIDLGAEQIIAAERGTEKIAVEVKSFLSDSNISEFHTALGQFINYRFSLQQVEPERVLYLAVPKEIYKSFFCRSLVKQIWQEQQLKLLVYNSNNEDIEQWIK